MPDKQLNIWIPEELRNYVAQRAEEERRGMNAIVADLIRQDMARREGSLVEHNSLIVLREMLTAELRQAHAQLRHDLREDRQQEADSQLEKIRKQVDRLAGLIVMAIRNSSIARRLSYTHLSKAFSPTFAKSAYDDARERSGQELLPKKAVNRHVLPDEAEA